LLVSFYVMTFIDIMKLHYTQCWEINSSYIHDI